MPHNNITGSKTATPPPLIFLDLDGVLADFGNHAQSENKIKPDGKIDWDALDYTWWVTMPAYKGAREFYDETLKLGVVRFLTGPVLNESCYAGKAHWVQDFVPERGKDILEDLIICGSENKFLVAAQGRILVDDRASNIKEWIEAGGIGILHTGDFKDTMKKLREAVSKLTVGSRPSPPKPPASRGPSLPFR